MSGTSAVEVYVDASPDTVHAYLSDPRLRPEWQSSLRRVEDVVGEGRVGTTWTDVTMVGARPRLWVTADEPGRLWAERGEWRGVTAGLRLDLHPAPTGTRVVATVDLGTPRALAPLGALLRGLAPYAVRSDLRRAARLIAGR